MSTTYPVHVDARLDPLGLTAPVLSRIASALVWTSAAVFFVGVVLLLVVLLVRPRAI